jgi:hypothetical protein
MRRAVILSIIIIILALIIKFTELPKCLVFIDFGIKVRLCEND